MKNNAEFEQDKPDLERQDAISLRKRAAEDAVKDADHYAFNARPSHDKTMGSKYRELLAAMVSPRHARLSVGVEGDIDGLLIHPCEGSSRLVLSDEISEISLVAEVEALEGEPISIFHVQTPAPWVQRVYTGSA